MNGVGFVNVLATVVYMENCENGEAVDMTY